MRNAGLMPNDPGAGSDASVVSAPAPALPRTPWMRLPGPVRDLITFALLVPFAFVPFAGVFTAPWVKVFLIAQALAVVLTRRRWPMIGLAVAAAFFLAAIGLGVASPAPAVAVAVAVFAVALRMERRPALITVLATLVVLLAAIVLFDRADLLDPRAFSLATIVAAAGGLGDAARSRRDYIVAITERALRAERTRENEAQRRVAEDRLRIARDLHDVVAHQIAVINLHAGVASSTLRARPDAADESLRTIRQASRAVLTEIGDLMAMLRAESAGGERLELAPIAGIDRLDELVAGFADVGLMVDSEFDGSLADVPPAVDLVAYRVVQEGLTNAHKHGSGTATLRVRRGVDGLCLRISNPRPRSESEESLSGYGLRGLRERVESVRGKTRIDTSDAAVFVLEVTLPLPVDTEVGVLDNAEEAR